MKIYQNLIKKNIEKGKKKRKNSLKKLMENFKNANNYQKKTDKVRRKGKLEEEIAVKIMNR